MLTTSDKISIGILILLIVIIVAYVIAMFELYKKQAFIFEKYTPPTPPVPHFYPLGTVRPMTQEEIDERNALIRNSANVPV